jgi:Class II flagellar assembly regulator
LFKASQNNTIFFNPRRLSVHEAGFACAPVALSCNVMRYFMIKIDNAPKVQSSKRAEKKRLSSSHDSGFSDIMDAMSDVAATDVATPSPAITKAAPIHSLDMLLSVQGVAEEVSRRQKQIKHANLTLDGLEELRLALLMGNVPVYLLHSIEQRMTVMKQSEISEGLRDVMEEIELRAAVELAKFKMQR